MDSFYLIVLGVATFVLIIMLAFLGWTMSQTKKGENYPQIVKSCPDNWTVDSTVVAGKVVCTKPSTLSNANLDAYMRDNTKAGYVDTTNKYINFADEKWSSYDPKITNPNCAKRKWASTYGIKWDSLETANYCE